MAAVMLTTTDNPFDPFTDFDKWYEWDMVIGKYNTCGWLARNSYTSPAFSDEMNDQMIELGMDELIKEGPFGGPGGVWKKVSRKM